MGGMWGRPAASSAALPGQGGRVKLVVFDFDQTISVTHVFKLLAGWGRKTNGFPVPAAASTELGQLRLINEMNRSEPYASTPGGFATKALGGNDRVQKFKKVLQDLKAQDADLVICTKGLVGAVQKCLSDLELLDFFTQVYGRVGEDYGVQAYDEEARRTEATAAEQKFLGTPLSAAWKSKDDLIVQLRKNAGLKREEAVLVEDDPEEIRRAAGTCRTLFVQEANGVTAEHLLALRRMTDPAEPPDAQTGAAAGEVYDEGLFAGGRGARLLPALEKSAHQKARARSLPTTGSQQRRAAMPRERR